MTSRRAVSPVIATVILIAVAVALGIAVAVWAGALTGGLQKTEKLIINSYQDSSGNFVISVTNSGASSITVTQVQVNSIPVAASIMKFTVGTNVTAVIPYTLASSLSGTFTILNANAVGLVSPDLAMKDGITYPITLVTAAGNSYPSTITWP
jgi:flagellin-like protein